ncbi:hypothetical protein [Longitalea arenae]|uniref:hypothetical protein n=1 Tax=Longitalea arenae TaxID=2812558 RepID=UPI001967312D|nr:hypothetical protein [Longitalea arenae]
MIQQKPANASCISFLTLFVKVQASVAFTPAMGMTGRNLLQEGLSVKLIGKIAGGLLPSEMAGAGYQYIVLYHLWADGRKPGNELQARPLCFTPRSQSLADVIHSKVQKTGIYSRTALPACDGVTGIYNFEERNPKTLSKCGIAYLKYDYCNRGRNDEPF